MNSQSEEIRNEMARVRRELDENVVAVVQQAKELADWRNFVRRHPLLTVSAAAAVGFLVVPKRLNVMSPDSETLEKLAKRNRLVVKPKNEVRRQAGLITPLVNLVTGAVLRASLSMAGQHFGKIVASNTTDQSTDVAGQFAN